jgi:hypothetical protein
MNSQDFRNLQEAYLDVYENEQLDEMPYRVFTKNDKGEEVSVGGKYTTGKTARNRANKGDETDGGVTHNVRKVEEETDIFDYVMEYLISEGYADNEEAAESIMVNMGEEWIHTIVEKFSMAANPSKSQSPIPTKLPTSSKKLKTRAITVVGTQKRQDKEIGLR